MLITNQDELVEICRLAEKHRIVFVDSEFIREKTYIPLLCLIQINVDGKCYLIDCLAPKINLEPFIDLLNDQRIIKVFHCLKQDFDVLSLNFPGKLQPRSVFDTQIMASFCGIGFSLGYASLSLSLLNITIDKNCQRSDWKKRPLSKEQLEYARLDVWHLPAIFDILRRKIIEQKKLFWLQEEMSLMIADCLNQNPLKSFSFNGRSKIYKNIIYDLVEWREKLAKENDIPKGAVLKDAIIEKIAYSRPKTLKDLNKKYGLRYNFLGIKFANSALSILQKNLCQEDSVRNGEPRSAKPTAKQRELYRKSQIILKEQADFYQTSPQLIINQSNLQKLIFGHIPIEKILFGWRYQALKPICEFML